MGLGYSHSRKNQWRDIRKDLCDMCTKKRLDRTTETPPSASKNAQKKKKKTLDHFGARDRRLDNMTPKEPELACGKGLKPSWG